MFLPGTVNLAVNDMVVQGAWLLPRRRLHQGERVTHNRLARVDTVTGALDATLTTSINNSVRDIELDAANNTLYVAGRFSSAGGATRAKLAGINLTRALASRRR